ncbi:MAG: hypothetical protein M1269_10985 [Chloroflexi bacterium]|nr:hypothetical protein [Chloroflexota bacterium]
MNIFSHGIPGSLCRFKNVGRNRGILKAHHEFRYNHNQKEKADFLGIHYSTVSVVLKKGVLEEGREPNSKIKI